MWVAGLAVAQVQREGEFIVGRGRLEVHGPRGVILAEESREPAALGLEGIHRKCVVTAAARMHHMISTTASRPLHPGIHYIECQRRMDADGGMQRGPRLPGAVAHACHKLSGAPGGPERYRAAVAADDIA